MNIKAPISISHDGAKGTWCVPEDAKIWYLVEFRAIIKVRIFAQKLYYH